MGMPQILAPHVQKLLDQGYYRFVAMFTWSGLEDKVALERLSPYIGHKKLQDLGIDPKTSQPYIDSETSQFYFLTGARTVLAIGYTKSGASLARFCASVTFGTDIKATVYHAVEGYEIAEAVPK